MKHPRQLKLLTLQLRSTSTVCGLISIVSPPAFEGWGKVLFSVGLSVRTQGGEGVPTLDEAGGRLRGTYLGGGVPTLNGWKGVPNLDGRYLPWIGGGGLLAWMREGYPTLNRGRVPYL